MIKLKQYLEKHRMITDGAFGTYYVQMTGDLNGIPEKANLERPEVVKMIHEQYIKAGAQLIRTNTFFSNTVMLKCGIEEVKNNIRAGYRLAKESTDRQAEKIFLAADIGPIPISGEQEEEEVLNEYQALCDTFIEEGAEILWFETFSDLKYIRPLANYIKQKKDITIVTNFCLNRYGYTKSGVSALKILKEAAEIEEIEGIGLNCGIGSGHMYQVLRKLPLSELTKCDKFLVAMPNSGYPEQIQDRMVYLDNMEYFSEKLKEIAKLGIHVVGGCCGTNPEYIKRAVKTVDLSGVEKNVHKDREEQAEVFKEARVVKAEPPNPFYMKLKTNKKVIAVELDPPYDEKYEKIMECANQLKAYGTDIITFADSPMGRSRADAILTSVKVANEVGIQVMPHISCRDRNTIAMRSQLIGAYMNGIQNFLIVTGDPVPSDSRGETTGVFDFNSVRLMEYVKDMNKENFKDFPLRFGGALNYARANLDKEIERMEKKVKAGADFFLTQPIFSKEDVRKIQYIKEKLDTKILCGIMPLVSYRNASFIKNEITGIHVPDDILDRYDNGMSREEGEETGIKIAVNVMRQLEKTADGYYFMLPFNRVYLVKKILHYFDV
jgi:methionine synthase I (cobalamin-dependent)/5,10-methylenetetrahydrofolate reductase